MHLPQWSVAGAFFIFLPLLFLSPGIFSTTDVLSAPGADLQTTFYFMRHFGVQSLLNGEIPLWNPYSFGGMPFVGILQTAVFYPLNVIFLLLPLNVAINGSIALHLALSGIFLYALLRHYQVGRLGAIVGGIVYTFSAPQIMHIYAGHLNILTTMIWLPLLFLFCDRLFKSGDVRDGLLLSLVIAFQFLAGNPQYLFYSIIALCCYFIFLLVFSYKDEVFSVRQIGKKILLFSLFILLGTSITAVQFLSTLEMLPHSTRQAVTLEWASIFSLPPESLITFLVPDFFGTMLETPYWGKNYLWEMSVYVGIVPLFLALVCICCQRNRHTAFFLSLTIFSLLLALGKYTPLFEVLYSYVPGFNLFRGNSKFVFIAAFALSILAGFGANALLAGLASQEKAKLIRALASASLLLLGSLLCLVLFFDESWFREGINASVARGEFYGSLSEVGQENFYLQGLATFQESCVRSALLILGTCLLLFLYGYNKVEGKSFQALLLVLLLLDLFSFGTRYMTTFDSQKLAVDSEVQQYLSKEKEPFRVIAPAIDNLNSGVLSGLETLGGYEALMLRRYSEYIHFSQGLSPDAIKLWADINKINILTHLLNARFLLLPVSAEFSGGNVVFENSRNRLYEIPDALPRAFLVHKAKVISERNEIFRELAEPSFDPRSYALVEKKPVSQLSPPPEAGLQDKVEFIRYSPNEIAMRVVTGSNGLLLLGNSYYPGWKASIDGKDAEVRVANHVMLSVEVPRGRHQVVFRFAPDSFRQGAIISLLSLLLVFLLYRNSCKKRHNS